MDAKELLQNSMDQVGYQLKMAFEGLADLDTNPIPAMFSPREQLAHLWEVYQAVLTEVAGNKHPWGEFVIPESVMANAYEECFKARAVAVAAILAGSDEAMKQAIDFIVLHDAYHVGQMCTLRLTLDPEWNAYSIYNH